jgi:hypothetical protein
LPGLSRRPIDFVETHLQWRLFEYSREFGTKLVHVMAEFHDRHDLIDLTSDLILAVFFQPLEMILQKMGVRIFCPKLSPNVCIYGVVNEHHDVLSPSQWARGE